MYITDLIKSSAITRVILRQCYVSSVLSLYGRAACGGQRYRISRSETANSLNIKHQQLTTQHSDIYVGFSTDDIQHNAVDKVNRYYSLTSINLTRVGKEEVSLRRVFFCIVSRNTHDLCRLQVTSQVAESDTDEFILPTGANKTRGRFELAFFTIGGCCITGAAFGTLNGFRMGLTETRDMPWSKPRNVQILNMVTRQGASWANTLGSVALLYSVFGVAIEKARGAEDDLNTVAAGTLTGMLFKSTTGLKGAARGGLVGLAMSGLYALYNNWDHLKGTSPSRY
uniref:Mitochondrial import inner membrane translocase subunit TIM23 n=2 Tax=Sinocyclocheilus rhinocerous TaxID=307959 RepID=A0A673LTF8_9TELE